MNETLKTLLDKKAESNNTIDLNAYALGLEDGFNANNWIKVSDRLPESDGDYLTCYGGSEIGFSTFKNLKYVWSWSDADGDCTDYVTHWQPLPSAPKD